MHSLEHIVCWNDSKRETTNDGRVITDYVIVMKLVDRVGGYTASDYTM